MCACVRVCVCILLLIYLCEDWIEFSTFPESGVIRAGPQGLGKNWVLVVGKCQQVSSQRKKVQVHTCVFVCVCFAMARTTVRQAGRRACSSLPMQQSSKDQSWLSKHDVASLPTVLRRTPGGRKGKKTTTKRRVNKVPGRRTMCVSVCV